MTFVNTSNDILLEHLVTPYHASCAVAGERIAILAPHPDDEVFGCGASACKWAAQGKTVQAFILTAGVIQEQGDNQQQAASKAQVRAQESRSAAQLLGLPPPIFMTGQDGQLWHEAEIESALYAQLQAWRPSTLVVPSIWEMHRDHRATAEMALRLLERLPSVEQITFYEVGVPLIANVLEDVSDYQQQKWQAMQCFTSQLAQQRYADQLQGLNIYRTYTLGLEVSFAEAFYCLAKSDSPAFVSAAQPEKMSQVLRHAEQAGQHFKAQRQPQQQRIHELEETLAQVYRSRSWRVTRPLRWLGHCIRTMRHRAKM